MVKQTHREIVENQKIAVKMNHLMIIITVIMMAIYFAIDATFIGYYSIFSGFAYAINYFFIRKYKMVESTWSTYANLTAYMVVCTVCLGYNYGYQLYSMSTIPLIYQLRYMSQKFNSRDPKATFCSSAIVVSCLLSSLYSVHYGPIYHIDGFPPLFFLGLNTVIVCFFLIFFSNNTMNQVIEFEMKLGHQANYDALTGLANRYNMINHLKEVIEQQAQKNGLSENCYDDVSENIWAAMLDVDDFKQINDKYGHATGDKVLETLSMTMQKICYGSHISRWGGEEFLICGKGDFHPILETLVKEVEKTSVQSPSGEIHFTISVGAANLRPSDTLDSWIVKADKLLYKAKSDGKNQINS